MKNPILVTESFSSGRDTYFFDFRLDVHNRKYLTMACCQLQDDQTYKRASLRFWERDFELVIQSFSSLFHHAAYADRQRGLFDEPLAAKGIKSWPPEFRPREKLAEQGRTAMADAELLAMLIGSGTPNETAVDLAEQILLSVDHDLKRLFELCRFRGMGMAKSSTIIAAMELSARLVAAQSTKVWMKKVL